MKTILSAVVMGAALTMTVPAQAAEGFGILLGGSGWKVPACRDGKVLREVRDQRTGKLVWRCVLPQQQTAQYVPAPRR